MRQAALLLALLFVAVPAAAQSNGTLDAVDDASEGTPLDGLLDGVGSAVEGVGSAVEKTGEGLGKGASAVGGAFSAAVQALASGVVAAATGVAQSGAAVAGALAGAAVAIGPALAWLGATATKGIALASTAVANAATWIGTLSLTGLVAYIDLVGGMRPDKMPVAMFATVTSVGAAGSAGAGGWAGFQALKKWGWLGSGLGGVAGFSRIDDDQLLEHPMRAQIFDVIKTHPGIHASQLAREMDVGWGTITHHLDKLTRAKMVTTRRVNNQKCFFEQGGNVSRQDMAIASALKGDTASTIAAFVQHHPMTSQKAMAESLGISPALASFHVKKLANLGVLEKVRHGKETLLTTSDGLRRVIESADPGMAAAFQHGDGGFEYSS